MQLSANHHSQIVLKPLEGLCNRMRAIASAIGLAKANSQGLKIIWEPTKGLNCSFHELFQPIEGVDFEEVEEQPIEKKAWQKYPTMSREGTFLQKVLQWTIFPNKPCKTTFHYDAFTRIARNAKANLTFEDDQYYNEYLLKKFAPWFEGLPKRHCVYIATGYQFFTSAKMSEVFQPVRQIQDKIDALISNHDLKNRIGVHIRGTDSALAKAKSPVELFLKAINDDLERDESATFFLATDEEHALQRLTSEFGDKIYYREAERTRNSSKGITDAVVDLYALASTRKILASYWSSFSQTAAAIGEIPRVVVRK